MDGGMESLGGQRARVVADLTLPEALVVWALRKHQPGNRSVGADVAGDEANVVEGRGRKADVPPIPESLKSLQSTFATVFGSRQLSAAIDCFGSLIASLEQGARCPLRINAYAEEYLSVHEEHLLSILAANQQGEPERAALLVQWLINPACSGRFIRHAQAFAEMLRNAGHSLTGVVMRVVAEEERIRREQREKRAPKAGQLEELTLGEAIIVRGTRRWVACLHQEQEPFPVLQAHFAHYGIIDSAVSLNAVLRNLAFAASRPIDIRGPACPWLSADETALLRAVAGLQRRNGTPAEETLSSWMPATAVRLSNGALSGLADSLLAAGLVLPLRETAVISEAQEHHARSWRQSPSPAQTSARSASAAPVPGPAPTRTLH